MRKVFLLLFLSLLFILTHESCGRKPFACFRTDVDEDSIHVNQPVIFSSACSGNAGSFFWEFYDNEDSIFFTHSVQKTFFDTGEVKVFLLVTNANKTSSVTRYIHVKP